MKNFSTSDYGTRAALCWSSFNLKHAYANYALLERVKHYYWSVFFVMLLSGLVNSNAAFATNKPYWEIKGKKEICEGEGYQYYTIYTKKHYKDDKYEWKFDKNDCGASIVGPKHGRTIKVHPGYKPGYYKLKCIIKRKEGRKYYTYYSYLHVKVVPKVYVHAGPDKTVCYVPHTPVDLDGIIKGCRDGGKWSVEKGYGRLNNEYSPEHASYTPTEQDLYKGYVVLKLAAKCYGKCGNSHDYVTIYFKEPAEVKPGGPYATCERAPVALTGSTVKGYYNSVLWTVEPASAGTISNANSLTNASFTASASAIGTTVTLRLTVYTKCGPVSKTTTVRVDRAATADAGPDQTICVYHKDQVRVALRGVFGGSATSGAFSSSNGGTFTNISTANGVVTATFDPTDDQIKDGSVTLTFTATPPSDNKCGPATDQVVIKFIKPYYAKCDKPGHNHGDDDEKCDRDDHRICSHEKEYKLYCKYDGPDGGSWSHNGKGYFKDEHSLTPTYVADASEIAEGKDIEVTFTPRGDKDCVRPCKYVIHCKKDDNCGHPQVCKLELEADITKIKKDEHGEIKREGAIDLEVKGGSGEYEYKWFHEGIKISEDEDLEKLTDPGKYRIVVIDKKTGCKIVCKFTVKVKPINPCGCKDDDDTSRDKGELDTDENIAPAAARVGSPAEQANLVTDGDKNLNVYPNTMTDRATIEFTLDKASTYTLELFDFSGRLVKQISHGKANAGQVLKFNVDGARLQRGIYFGRLSTPNSTRAIRIVRE